MKKFFAFLLCTATLAGFAGCSDDDDEVDLAQLIGKWECYKDYDGEYDEWDDEYGEGVDLYLLEFRNDGTGACLDDIHYTGTWRQFTYSVNGNMLYWDIDDKTRIEKLTSSELVLAYDYEGDDGRQYTDKEYYKRID